MGGEECFESTGQWWWFVLLLASALGAFALFVTTVGLWTGVLPSDRTEEAPVRDEDGAHGESGWRGWLRRHAGHAFAAVVLVTIVVGAARRGDWQMVGVGVGGVVGALVLARVGGRVLEGPLESVTDVIGLRLDAMVDARPLTPTERRRVVRARVVTSAALVACLATFVVMLGLYGGTMVEVACPE